MTWIPILILKELRVVSMGHLQRLRHASRHSWHLVRFLVGTCLCSNCWDQFLNLSCLFSTFHVEYPSVLGTLSFFAYNLWTARDRDFLFAYTLYKWCPWLVAFEEHQIFPCFKIDWNCNCVGLLHHPFWLQLVLALFRNYFQFFKLHLWLRITDEGSVPEMRIWSISLI